jgi:hypothetical protein
VYGSLFASVAESLGSASTGQCSDIVTLQRQGNVEARGRLFPHPGAYEMTQADSPEVAGESRLRLLDRAMIARAGSKQNFP